MPDLNSYKTRRTWSDSHLEAVRCALGRKFFAVSSFKQDTQFGVDLFIPELKMAVRIRQIKYKNFKDFTLRTSAPKGLKSEYAKLLSKDNQCDFLFYAFALDKDNLAAGYLIDLQSFRSSLLLKEVKPQFKRNRDGSHFVAFEFSDSYSEQIV